MGYFKDYTIALTIILAPGKESYLQFCLIFHETHKDGFVYFGFMVSLGPEQYQGLKQG